MIRHAQLVDVLMSSVFGEAPQRKSKQQASKNITEQSRKRPLNSTSESSSSSTFPAAVYGEALGNSEALSAPRNVMERDTIINGLLMTVSNMYFGTTGPFAEILRCLDDRIDPHTHRYISGLETLLKNEILDPTNNKNKASKEKVIITPLDMLSCAFRKPEVIDGWTPYDIVMFELAICANKGFHPKQVLTHFEGRKSLEDLTVFFDQVYSKSDSWRKIQKVINNEALSDVEEMSVKSEMDLGSEDEKSPPSS